MTHSPDGNFINACMDWEIPFHHGTTTMQRSSNSSFYHVVQQSPAFACTPATVFPSRWPTRELATDSDGDNRAGAQCCQCFCKGSINRSPPLWCASLSAFCRCVKPRNQSILCLGCFHRMFYFKTLNLQVLSLHRFTLVHGFYHVNAVLANLI